MKREPFKMRKLTPGTWCDSNAEFAAESGYRDFDRGDSACNDPPSTYPVLFELVEPQAVGDVRALGIPVPAAYPDKTRFATAWLDETQYAWLRSSAWGGLVKRWALQLPVIPLRQPVRMTPLQSLPAARLIEPAQTSGSIQSEPPKPPSSTVIGVIDTGCPFADPRYRRHRDAPWETRIRALWDQTDGAFAGIAGARRPPPDFGRGAELRASDIDAWLRACSSLDGTIDGAFDEDLCYRRAGYAMMPEGFVHGAAVMDLAAGPRSLAARYPTEHRGRQAPPRWRDVSIEKASTDDIIFVQVARNAVEDSTSASLPMQVLDALRYIVERALDAEYVVVNLSDGTSRALHDGSSLLEDAIRDLIVEVGRPDRKPGPLELELVVAAGNVYMQARHAVLTSLLVPSVPLTYGADVTVMNLPVDNEQAVFLNIGVPGGSCAPRLRITPPAALSCDPLEVGPGEVVTWTYDGQPCFWVVIPPTYGVPVLALAAWSPTAFCRDGRRSAPAGNWSIQCLGSQGAEFPLWISLAQNNVDGPSAIRQARFCDADDRYDPTRWMRDVQLDPMPPLSVIRRTNTLSVPATMAGSGGVAAVGAVMMRVSVLPTSRYFDKNEGTRSAYSSIGASLIVPPERRPADFSRTQPGIRGAGSPSGAVISVTGTSFASPQYVRELANKGP